MVIDYTYNTDYTGSEHKDSETKVVPQTHRMSKRVPGKFNRDRHNGRNVEGGNLLQQVKGQNKGFNWIVTD